MKQNIFKLKGLFLRNLLLTSLDAVRFQTNRLRERAESELRAKTFILNQVKCCCGTGEVAWRTSTQAGSTAQRSDKHRGHETEYKKNRLMREAGLEVWQTGGQEGKPPGDAEKTLELWTNNRKHTKRHRPWKGH